LASPKLLSAGYTLLNVLQVIHANLRINFGPFRWFWASPEFHRWHHSTDLEARDKNFSAHLPLFDILFGTFYMPRGKTPSEYGLEQPVPATYVAQFLHPFRTISRSRENRPVARVPKLQLCRSLGEHKFHPSA
jgi:sterol desaturase/sphingolipid hydroxylase (fatty acid hydroxylase superfamily)